MLFNKKEIEQKLENLLIEKLHPLGYKLVAIDFLNAQQGPHLRIYVDKEKGITLDDLASLHRKVQSFIEEENLDELRYRNYSLELSSPGARKSGTKNN